jgi:hypothetical protein
MTTLVSTRDDVLNIQEDIVNSTRILFSDYYSIQLFDGIQITPLVGGKTFGYTEGVGTDARFFGLYNFLKLNSSAIIIADCYNYCIRVVDRETWGTSRYAGNCTSYGYRDGDDALFGGPWGIIKDPHSDDKLIVTDSGNDAIRQLDINTRITTTLVKGGIQYPRNIVYDSVTDTFLLSSSHDISRYDSNTNVITVVSGGRSAGFSDGALVQAKFDYPRNLIILNERVALVADIYNSVIRVLDFNNNTVSSVCIPQSYGTRVTADGSAKTCKLAWPYGLLYRDGLLYVGQYKAIRTILCEYNLSRHK